MNHLMNKPVLNSEEILDSANAQTDITTEGIFGDIMEDIGDGVIGTAVFLKHLATLDMKKYFEDRHRSDIYLQVVSAKRYIDNNKNSIDFGVLKNDVIHVPVGFAFRQKLMIDIIEENLEPTKIATLSILREFNIELGKIISSKKYREGGDVLKEIQDMKTKLHASTTESYEVIDKRITSLMTSTSKEELWKLAPSLEELSNNLHSITIQLKLGDEVELKGMLSDVDNLAKRISVYEKLERDGEIDEKISSRFNELVTSLAASVTVVAKLHHALYTVGEINSTIVLETLR